MRFPTPLVEAKLLKRYKRFLADVEFQDGVKTTIHCANPGAMTGLDKPGSKIWVSKSSNPKRKLQWSWELIEVNDFGQQTLVGINTQHPNRLVEEALVDGKIPQLAGFQSLKREVKYGDASRIDFLLEYEDQPPCYLEVKNVHLLRQKGLAEFPDCVTKRGAKHLTELQTMVEKGARSVMLYLVQRDDVSEFGLARDIDPAYAVAFDLARDAGVEAMAWSCKLSPEVISVDKHLPIRISDSL